MPRLGGLPRNRATACGAPRRGALTMAGAPFVHCLLLFASVSRTAPEAAPKHPVSTRSVTFRPDRAEIARQHSLHVEAGSSVVAIEEVPADAWETVRVIPMNSAIRVEAVRRGRAISDASGRVLVEAAVVVPTAGTYDFYVTHVTRAAASRVQYTMIVDTRTGRVGLVLEGIVSQRSGETWHPTHMTVRPFSALEPTDLPAYATRDAGLAVVGGGTEQRFVLITVSLPARIVHRVTAWAESAARAEAIVRAPSEWMLPPGVAHVVLDGHDVGSFTLPTIEASSEFRVPLGVEPRISVERMEVSVPARGGDESIIRCTLRSGLPGTTDLTFEERIFQVKEVRSRVLAGTTRGWTRSTRRHVDVLEWHLTLDPGETREMALSFSLPRDKEPSVRGRTLE